MNKPKSSSQTVVWWVLWIVLTIGSFFIAAAVWTPLIAKHFGSVRETRASVIWVAAVFGTWMVLLLPLIVVMYQKVDKAYEDARVRREKAANRFRSILIDKPKRLLAPNVSAKLKDVPETIEGGHLVTVLLKDGRKIPNVFIAGREEILGIYDYTEMPFEGKEVVDVIPEDFTTVPNFFTTNWLRLDGTVVVEDGGAAPE